MTQKNNKTVASVIFNKIHVQILAIDYDALEIFTVTMTYKELEKFAREHGEKDKLGNVPRKISTSIRDSLES